ncbi:MAG: UDP binding domain-containing protein [Phycisphaerae bacterium]
MPASGAILERDRVAGDQTADRCASGFIARLAGGEAKAGIWGLGYLGYHNLVRLLTRQVSCVVTDSVAERLDRVASSGFVADVLHNYHGFRVSDSGRGSATVEVCEPSALAGRNDVIVHLVCVPTEKDGQPSDEPLAAVMQALAASPLGRRHGPVLIVLESSGAPGAIDRIVLPALERAGHEVGRHVCVGAAPRADYGRSPFESPTGCVRVVGGVTPRCGALLSRFYEFTGVSVRLAASHREAELACAVFRGAQHLLMSYSNQLALAFGTVDVREVVDLAASVGPLVLPGPGLGSSGYFLPFSANHLRDSADEPEMLTLLDEAFRCDLMMAGVVADRVVEAGVRRLAILGLSALADGRNHIHSPVLRLARALRGRLAEVSVCDPFYDDEEVAEITGFSSLQWPAGLEGCDGVVVVTAHRAFRTADASGLTGRLKNARLVLDCCGAWVDKGLREAGVPYAALGRPGWGG